MIKALWFFINVALFIAGSIWLISQPGDLSLHFLGYDIKVQTGVFILALIVFVLFCFYLLQFVRSVLRAPKTIASHKQSYDQKVGYLSLTRGLVAVASGDAEKATHYADKASKLLKEDQGLPLLLQAQAARLTGDEAMAQQCFEALSQNKDTAFLGVKGLMSSALVSGSEVKALDYAKEALQSQPNQPQLLQTVYDLSLRTQQFDDALKLAAKLQKNKTVPTEKLNSDRVAIYLHRYDTAGKTMSDLKAAYKLNPHFVPTVTRLARSYIEGKKRRKAVQLIEAAWKENPHPELAQIWADLAPRQGKDANTKRLAWMNRLVEANPNSVEAYIAAAQTAIDLEYWGEAKAYLMAAEKIYPTAQIFHLRALAEKNITHNEDHVEGLLDRAAKAMPTKVWVCSKTGMIYEEWSAIAMPHESFNTIIWDMPSARVVAQDNVLSLRENEVVRLLDPAA